MTEGGEARPPVCAHTGATSDGAGAAAILTWANHRRDIALPLEEATGPLPAQAAAASLALDALGSEHAPLFLHVSPALARSLLADRWPRLPALRALRRRCMQRPSLVIVSSEGDLGNRQQRDVEALAQSAAKGLRTDRRSVRGRS